jgi:hypothetical protein
MTLEASLSQKTCEGVARDECALMPKVVGESGPEEGTRSGGRASWHKLLSKRVRVRYKPTRAFFIHHSQSRK